MDPQQRWRQLHLRAAILSLNDALVRSYLSTGASARMNLPADEDEQGLTVPPLCFVASAGVYCDSTWRVLVEHGADVNGVREDDRKSALHVCVCRGGAVCAEFARFLLDNGADANVRDGSQLTPLHYACLIGRKDFVQTLLPCSNLELRTPIGGSTALYVALYMNRREISLILLRAGAHLKVLPSGSAFRAPVLNDKMIEMVNVGGWAQHVRAHRRRFSGLVSKCSALPNFPDDAACLVVDFWLPKGGW